MSKDNRELQEMLDLLGRFNAIAEQPKNAVTTGELQQFKELLELVPEETSYKTFFEICDVSDRELSYLNTS